VIGSLDALARVPTEAIPPFVAVATRTNEVVRVRIRHIDAPGRS
jgi:hypothetical protein